MNIVKIRLNKLLLAAGLIAVGGAVQAAPITFDFGAIGVNNEGANPNEMDGIPVGLRFDGSDVVFSDGFSGSGLQVIATGQDISGSSNNPFAYLDEPFQGRQAGLGVCQSLSGNNHCNPSSDDNITGTNNIQEQLTLAFNSEVTLSDFIFKGAKHFGVDEDSSTGAELFGSETFLLNGNETTFADAQAGLLNLVGDSFTFAFGGNAPERFYLGSVTADVGQDVPAPAGVGLLGLALIGLGAAARRRRTM